VGAMIVRAVRGLGLGALLIALAAPVGFGQAAKVPDWQAAAGGTMSFDVASIRPTKEGEFTPPNFPLSSDDAYGAMGGNFSADFPVEVYIEFAYKLWLSAEQRKAMLANLPKWVNTDRYEIHAKGPANATKDQMRLMVQALLAERFKLAVHFENQEVPVLAMTLIKPGKTGPKLTPHVDICDHDAPPPGKEAMENDVFPPPCSGGLVHGLCEAEPRGHYGFAWFDDGDDCELSSFDSATGAACSGPDGADREI
jgi:hypothetical protein